MKKGSLPNAYKKRKSLNEAKLSPEKLVALGEIHLEQGRFYDAAQFFLKASNKEGLARVRSVAIEEGDAFLYSVTLGKKDGKEDTRAWEELGKRAMELKKYAYAVRAFEKAGNGTLRNKAEEALKESKSD